MTIRSSKAFAAYRQAVIAELTQTLVEQFVPAHNAEIEDIRIEHKKTFDFALTQPDSARNKLIELADKKRKARILDLAKRKQDFLGSLKVHLNIEMKERLTEYNAEQVEEMEERNGKEVKVVKAVFPDGSKAKIPQGLFIDFSLFQRI